MKRQIILSALVIVVVGFGASVLAQVAPPPPTEEEINSEALAKTQELLRNPELRKDALTTQPAQTADSNAKVTGLGKATYTNEIYNISSDLLPWVLQNFSNIDLSSIAKDPSSLNDFIAKMPSSEREKIKKLADKIEKERAVARDKP